MALGDTTGSVQRPEGQRRDIFDKDPLIQMVGCAHVELSATRPRQPLAIALTGGLQLDRATPARQLCGGAATTDRSRHAALVGFASHDPDPPLNTPLYIPTIRPEGEMK